MLNPLVQELFSRLPSIAQFSLEKFELNDKSFFENFLKNEYQNELFVLCRVYSIPSQNSSDQSSPNVQNQESLNQTNLTQSTLSDQSNGMDLNSSLPFHLEGLEKFILKLSHNFLFTDVNGPDSQKAITKSVCIDIWDSSSNVPWETLQSKQSFHKKIYNELGQPIQNFIVMNQCLLFSIFKMVGSITNLDDLNNVICTQIPIQSSFKAYHQIVKQLIEPHLKKQLEYENRKNPDVIQSLEQLSVSLSECLQEYNIPEINMNDYIHPEVASLELNSNFVATPKLLVEIHERVELFFRKLKDLSSLTFDIKEITSTSREIGFWKVYQSRLETVLTHSARNTAAILIQSSDHSQSHAGRNLISKLDETSANYKKVSEYVTQFMAFPEKDIQLADSVTSLSNVFKSIFSFLNNIISKSNYPLERLSAFIKCIADEIIERLLSILKGFMSKSYQEFMKIVESCDLLLDNFQKELNKSVNDTSKNCDTSEASSVTLKLLTRIKRLGSLRKQHHDFKFVIEQIFTSEDSFSQSYGTNVSISLDLAYEILSSKESFLSFSDIEFESLIIEYNKKIDSIENNIVQLFKNEIGLAKSGSSKNEIFQVFKKYNGVFYRPKIMESVQEYQEELIEIVDKYLDTLTQKYSNRTASNIEIEHFSHIYDVPKVISSILHSLEIEHQLDIYMNRLDDIFGLGWERLFLLIENKSWEFNQEFAECIGIDFKSFENLIKNEEKNFPKLNKIALGTALALAHLENVSKEMKPNIQEIIDDAKMSLNSHIKNLNLDNTTVMEFAKKLIEKHGVDERHAQERILREKCYNFKKKIKDNIELFFKEWYERTKLVKQRQISLSSIFRTKKNNSEFIIKVDFDRDILNCSKEGRFFLSNQEILKKIDPRTKEWIIDITKVYSLVISLKETTKTFLNLKDRMNVYMKYMLDEFIRNVTVHIESGFKKLWPQNLDFDLWNPILEFSQDYSRSVFFLHEKVVQLERRIENIERLITEIENNHNSIEKIKETIRSIQHEIDDSILASYKNMGAYVNHINSRLENILLQKLISVFKEWNMFFTSELDIDQETENVTSFITNLISNSHLKVYIRFENRQIHAEPNEDQIQMYWYNLFHNCIGTILNLPLIKSESYDASFFSKNTISTFIKLQNIISSKDFESVYIQIDSHVKIISSFIQDWRNNQALWNITDVELFNLLGDDISKWVKLIEELIEGARSSESDKIIGRTSIHLEDISNKIREKYNSTLQTIFSKFQSNMNEFGEQLFKRLSGALDDISKIRVELNVDNAILYLTNLLGIQKHHNEMNNDVNQYIDVSKLLSSHLVSLNIPHEQILGIWEELNQTIEKKNAKINENKSTIISKINSDDEDLSNKMRLLESDWKLRRNDSELMNPDEALKRIKEIEDTYKNLIEKEKKLHNAQEVLDLELSFYRSTINPEKSVLHVIGEEINNLITVWSSLKHISSSVEEARDQLFNTVIIKHLKEKLILLLDNIKKSPTWMHSYKGFIQNKQSIESYIKTIPILSDLKTEAMVDRHWKSLRKQLGANWQLTELTLGQLWDTNIESNEHIYKDIIRVAQGELVLEVHLREIQEKWSLYQFHLTNYHNKCFLIKEWDELFDQVNDHISSLSSMRSSPYFKTFKDECIQWENYLNQIRVISDLWQDVQRTWVYLEGIYTGNKDVKLQLPAETAKFNTLNNTFKALMRKVQSNPLILDVITIPNCEKSLESLKLQLQRVQKALGEYLEKQRAAFPRFYFVGDEDLLEIIGNSDDPQHIQKHLKKMFSGIASLHIEPSDPETNIILSFASQEQEIVNLKTPVEIKSKMRINEWLSNLDIEMKKTLATILDESVISFGEIYFSASIDFQNFESCIELYPAQIIILTIQILWTQLIEKNLPSNELQKVLNLTDSILSHLASNVLNESISFIHRKKYEYLITELVHQRDVTRLLIEKHVSSPNDFDWLYYMRFYHNPTSSSVEQKIKIQIANSTFSYGFEYLGLYDKLVQTPLTDRCYLGLTQALNSKLGGSPFGPAGTGKTETVKSLANSFGRFVLVFCCDENFDFKAMGRIFVGICMCGAWGCFDEFNRLQEKILSAVSQQILSIQTALKNESYDIELIDRPVRVNPDTGIFITMNPGYAGRSNLPENLKQLFRSIAMVKPDKELIAQVILYSHGFRFAENISRKVVLFFSSCSETLSSQSHYDFGLRALKTVLVNAGMLKRKSSISSTEKMYDSEQAILIQSILETMTPKLVVNDVFLLKNLVLDIFPSVNLEESDLTNLRNALSLFAQSNHLTVSEEWVQKVIQLYQIQNLSHGVILVGPSGCGKTTCWKGLVNSIEAIENIKNNIYVIDPKSLTKNDLYGFLDSTTREWTDGIFTHILRKVVDSARGEQSQRHWIIFDGDVDPEWVENLNSVLDDNKLFTLPNGERLSIPNNLRFLFEVRNLDYATLATVSRCGMIWFSQDIIDIPMRSKNFLDKLRNEKIEENQEKEMICSVQQKIALILEKPLLEDNTLEKVASFSEKCDCIMEFNISQALDATFDLIREGITSILDYNIRNIDFPISDQNIKDYIEKRFIFSVFWGFGSIMTRLSRKDLSNFICSLQINSIPEFDEGDTLLDYTSVIDDSAWSQWRNFVTPSDIENKSTDASLVTTPDTLRHEELLLSWIHNKRNAILCGPPGSGKTMIMTAVLKSLTNYESVALNFSSNTGFDLILKTLEQYCVVNNGSKGFIMKPKNDKKLIIFCDEINLPANDKYGTQLVVTFMRQLIEQNGFWRASDHSWIHVENVVFVGACNPPTDPGRVIMTPRFLRHCPVLFVDFPSKDSLLTIYDVFNSSIFKLVPSLAGLSKATTESMVEIFEKSQKRFTPDMQPHYIYSPRELSRWIRALQTVFLSNGDMTADEFLRLFVHEGLRIFVDRLVYEEEKQWTESMFEEVVCSKFNVDSSLLQKPILFSNLLSRFYTSVKEQELRDFLASRLHTFSEEEIDVKLVLFDSVLEHILRIDRVLKQPLGHMLLAGASGAGKTILSKFVSWLNGYSVFQIKAHKNYVLVNFEEDLREILKRAGCKREKICFIFDEANALESSFLEYMNALLASGEVPGLFEDAEMANLINTARSEIRSLGIMNIENDDEVYQWFIKQVQQNLHVIFTINPANSEFKNRAATSPALFNRCVVDWFGDWTQSALYQVASDYTKHIPIQFFPGSNDEEKHEKLTSVIVSIHNTVRDQVNILNLRSGKKNFITPRHYIDFLHHFLSLHKEKMLESQEQQLHVNRGLQALKETELEVSKLQQILYNKKIDLADKNKLADDKLKIIVKEKQIAQTKKDESMSLAIELNKQSNDIKQRKEIAEADLSKVQPQLEEAQNALKEINRRHLDELRNLANPPDLIKATLEAVCIMLNKKSNAKYDWATIRKFMRGVTFIKDIIEFDSILIDEKMRQRISKEFLPELPYEAVRKASIACGPMVKWMQSQVSYSDILTKVEPLRKEVEELEIKTNSLRKNQEILDESIKQLEKSISEYEMEYEQLLKETQHIKLEIDNVNTKVERSVNLLKSLGSETIRWQEQSNSFAQQSEYLIGNVLLCSAFLTYIGQFDEYHRKLIDQKWKDLLGDTVPLNFDASTYLTTADKKSEWQSNGLPSDDLCSQNAIIMERFNRSPLIIDPTGQGVEFLMNQLKSKKIIKTSFLDSGFVKTLEACVRWGTPLLVQDAENLDPILNPILNKEFRKVGGRTLVGIGSQDIDVSESFTIYLSTRDPTFSFPADLSSRVTFVNFTVTPSSLQAQCLGIILKHERPEIEKQRNEQLKLQSQYKLKQKALETSLLKYISESKGNLLENEELIATLENLKHSSAEIQTKVEQVEEVVKNLAKISATYTRLSNLCSKAYFIQEQLQEIYFLYQFSVNHFIAILNYILKSEISSNSTTERIQLLSRELFRVVFSKTSRSMRHKDHLPFALRLAQLYIEGTEDEIPSDEFELLLKPGVSLHQLINTPQEISLSTSQKRKLTDLSQLRYCINFENHFSSNLEEWKSFIEGSEDALSKIFDCFEKSNSKIVGEFRKMMLINMFIPSKLDKYCYNFIDSVFGSSLLKVPEINLEIIVEKDQDCYTPLLLVSMPGYDPSEKISNLSLSLKKHCKSIAMGTIESYERANTELKIAMQKGTWIHLKNVHLSSGYLSQLEKNIHAMKLEQKAHQDFRLFLTSELHPGLPVNILSLSYIILYETPTGIKANLTRSFANLSKKQIDRTPNERGRLHLLLAWLHALIMERQRYIPIGWSKKYEFSEVDFKWAFEIVDAWIDKVAGSQTHVKPEEMPWKAITTLLSESVYGGKIDNDFDQKILQSLINRLFVPESYHSDFNLVPEDNFNMPEEISYENISKWIENIPPSLPPHYLGLPSNVKTMIQKEKAKDIIRKLSKISSNIDEQLIPIDIELENQNLWKKVSEISQHWLSALPDNLDTFKFEQFKLQTYQNDQSIDPLIRSVERELITISSLLKLIRKQLIDINSISEGTLKPTNTHWILKDLISRQIIPRSWNQFSSINNLTLSEWIIDFSARVKHISELIDHVCEGKNVGEFSLWLGGLLYPSAFINATRQYIAEEKKVSLELIHPLLIIGKASQLENSEKYFNLKKLNITSATLHNNAVVPIPISDSTITLYQPIEESYLIWTDSNQKETESLQQVPLYLNSNRNITLLVLQMSVEGDSIYEKGVAITAWSQE